MNSIDTIIKFNYHLYSPHLMRNRILSPFRYVTRVIGNFYIPKLLERDNHRNKYKEVPITVSLTSFPARIENVWIVIQCFLRQTYMPKNIILWLSKNQFPNELKDIPSKLKTLIGNRFQICFVDGDIRSHKKYYYVCKDHPNDLIFLADDDIFYPSDIIERTYNEHLDNEDAVICNYGYRIRYEENILSPYNSWNRINKRTQGYDLFFGSGGGTLLQPKKMYKDLTNIDLALKLTPIADDIWLNTMCRLKQLPYVILSNGLILPVLTKSDITLAQENLGQNQNDVQINAIIKHYSHIDMNPF